MITKEYFTRAILISKEKLMVPKRHLTKIINYTTIVLEHNKSKIFLLSSSHTNLNGECKSLIKVLLTTWTELCLHTYSQGGVTDCGQYLIVTTGRDCQYNMVFFCDLTKLPDNTIKGKLELTSVVDKMEADYEVTFRSWRTMEHLDFMFYYQLTCCRLVCHKHRLRDGFPN